MWKVESTEDSWLEVALYRVLLAIEGECRFEILGWM
jgi:hypothetical protein